jgi:phosphate butyryltransferase
MIRSYKDIYRAIENIDPVSIAIINPKIEYLNSAIKEAELRGWIKPNIFMDEDKNVSAKKAVLSVTNGESDLLMKGGDVDTATILKAVLTTKNFVQPNKWLSHVAVVETLNYNRLLMLTDGGVNPKFTPDIIDGMIENVLCMANVLDNSHPNIAMLTLVEKVTEKVPETVFAHETVQRYRKNSDLSIEGPISIDVAISKTAAKSKNITSVISGETDVFMGPNITTTNFVVKALMALGGAKGGGLILGANAPIVLLSRSDNMETKLNSIALGILALKGEK